MEPYIDNQFQSLPISTNNTTSLLRLHSAPSAFLSSYRDGSGGDIDKGFDFINQPFPVGTHHQSAPSIPRFLSATARRGADDDLSSPTRGFQAAETKPFQISSDGYTGFESNQLSNTQYRHPAMEVPTSMGLNQSTPVGTLVSNGGGGSCLARQTSSPAGFFAHLEAQNGYNSMEAGVSGELRSGTGSRRETSGHTRLSRLKSHTDFSSSLGHLPRIPETGTELGVVSKESCSSPVGGGHRKRYRNRDDENGDGFIPFVSWSDSPSIIPENSPNHHQHQATAASNQKGGGVSSNHGHTLTHHLSLPRTAGEVAAVEKLLNFEESVVPWKIRAKRGCATHPRSIAERVRRTRISEKMKKLQELVPNMDKQINTSDMLDLAVNYIKELQDHFKVLSDSKARCRCQNAQYCA